MLNLSELRDYRNWISKSPVEIRESAIKTGGWIRVFPRDLELKTKSWQGMLTGFEVVDKRQFPEWASRVRNYFNQTPASLKLLPAGEAMVQTLTIKDKLITWFPGAHDFALSGDVYVDENQRPWFEMSTAGTVYHYPGEVDKRKKVGAFLSSQATIPVFKLISPDDTGGSLELIVKNPQVNKVELPWGETVYVGKRRIGETGVVTYIKQRTEFNEIYQGSYNYSETVIKGLSEHEYRDVSPHKENKGFYVNPDSPYSALNTRRFPASLPPYA